MSCGCARWLRAASVVLDNGSQPKGLPNSPRLPPLTAHRSPPTAHRPGAPALWPAPPPRLQHLVGVLNEYKAAHPAAPVPLARKMDGALLAIGTLSDVLKARIGS